MWRSIIAQGAVRIQTPLRTTAVPRMCLRRGMAAAAGPVDDRQIGDYPVVPGDSAQLKDPFKYWDQQDRRNFEETLHEDDEALSMWVVDEQAANGRVNPNQALKQLLFMLGVVAFVLNVAKLSRPESKNPVHPRKFSDHDE